MFQIGQVVTNEELYTTFGCSNSGGVRRSKKNTLTLITDHTKALYEDIWADDIMLYTGMGQESDQSFEYEQNKTLNESQTNNIQLHFFEVERKKQYIYKGLVELTGKPYMDTQDDKNGNPRKACVSPLNLITSA